MTSAFQDHYLTTLIIAHSLDRSGLEIAGKEWSFGAIAGPDNAHKPGIW